MLWSGTFFPEEGVAAYVGDLVDAGVELFKLHLQVGEFHLDDPLLDEVWGLLEDADTPVVVHAGPGPVGNDFTGPGSMQRLLERHPRLRHHRRAHGRARGGATSCGWPRRYDECGWTRRWSSPTSACPTPTGWCRGWSTCSRKILLGTDFPTIPYPYAHQLERLARLDLGDDWLRAVCWENGAALFGLTR